MLYKEDWSETKERLTALWEKEIIDRCCISVTAPKYENIDTSVFAMDCKNESDEELKDCWENPERILKRNIKRMKNTFFGGEALPQIFLNFGTSGHAVYYGARYQYTLETIWYFPIINDWEEDPLFFNKDNEFLRKQFDIATFLSNQGKGKFFVSMPDNCGTLDALAHLRGTDNLLIDMILNKEQLKKAIHLVNKGWENISERFFKITSKCNHGGSSNGWMNTWAPGRHAQMQCDLSVMISPEQFKEFVIPELEEQMEWIEYPVYHLDGKEQINHLDSLLGLKKLKMIQWTNVEGQEPPVTFLPALERIQNAGKALIVFTPIEDVPKLLAELSSKGLYLITTASSQNEAEELIKYVDDHTRE